MSEEVNFVTILPNSACFVRFPSVTNPSAGLTSKPKMSFNLLFLCVLGIINRGVFFEKLV